VITEARLERIASGLVPITPGLFMANTADAAWVENEAYGGVCIFESDDVVLQGRPDLTAYEKPEAGFTIRVVPPGRPVGLYHAESVQEDFLILMGECVLVIEDQERHLRAWDFVHCPPMTAHTFVATGTEPCSPPEPDATTSSGYRLDPRSHSATTQDRRSIRPAPSAEAAGRFDGRGTGTSSRGLSGRSTSRVRCGVSHGSAAAHPRNGPRPSPARAARGG
jgi:mannose-6-phosphate isomerase-like protein (cupin superfamily)